MSVTSTKQTLFVNGIASERITASRDSEIYQSSARDLVNLNITELGNLSITKKKTIQSNFINNIKFVNNTKFGHYIVTTDTHVYTIVKNGNSYTKDAGIVHGLTITDDTNFSITDSKLFICTSGATKAFDIKGSSAVADTTFLNQVILPINNKKTLTIDIYKFDEITPTGATTAIQALRLVYSATDPELSIDTNGLISLPGRTNNFKRLYPKFKTVLEKDDIDLTGLVKGDFIGVFRDYNDVSGDNKYYIGNTEIVFHALTDDNVYGSGYFSKADTTNVTKEKLVFGEKLNIISEIVDIGIMQSRLFIMTSDKIYFSRTFDYKDFRNGAESEDPFYIQPTPINETEPKLLRGITGKGLYVMSHIGVYVVAYNKVLTPTTITVTTASDTPATRRCAIVDSVLFFLTPVNKLKVLQSAYNKINDTFYTFAAEKYDIQDTFHHISRGTIDSTPVLLAQKTTDASGKFPQRIYAYKVKGTNEYNKISFDASTFGDMKSEKVFALDSDFITNNVVGIVSEHMEKECLLSVLPPEIKTINGGSFLNDSNSKIVKVVLKAINRKDSSGTKAIKTVDLAGERIGNIGSNLEDRFSIYSATLSKSVDNGYDVNIETNETTEDLEILGIETFVNVAGILKREGQ